MHHAPPRHADVLKESGYTGDLETFRETLAAVKAELYPDITDEILCFGKETSARFCAEVGSDSTPHGSAASSS